MATNWTLRGTQPIPADPQAIIADWRADCEQEHAESDRRMRAAWQQGIRDAAGYLLLVLWAGFLLYGLVGGFPP